MEENNTSVKNKKNKTLILIIIVSCAIVAMLSVSYAFLGSNVGSAWFKNITAFAYTVDEFTYDSTGDANENFPFCNKSNLEDLMDTNAHYAVSKSVTVKYRKGNETIGTATRKYSGIVSFDASEIISSSSSEKPSILLTITDPSGNRVTQIDGLEYTTAAQVSGFKIEGKTGKFTFTTDYEISSSVTTKGESIEATEQEWRFVLTYIYYADSVDQTYVCDKTLNLNIIIGQKDSDGNFRYPLNSTIIALNGGSSYIQDRGTPQNDMEPTKEYYLPATLRSDISYVKITSCLSYATSYSINQDTGKIEFINPSYCCDTSCWSNLTGTYIPMPSGEGEITSPTESASILWYVTNAYMRDSDRYISFYNNSVSSRTVDDEKGMFEGTDTAGITLYFRGAVDNNYLEFAGIKWRIIRINGDGSVRLVYAEDEAYATSLWTNSVADPYTTSLLYSKVNDFYTTKLSNYADYIVDAPFTTTPDGAPVGSLTSNMYSVSGGSISNPVGLVTEGEFIAAGGKYTKNVKNYLAFSGTYWGMGLYVNSGGTLTDKSLSTSAQMSNYSYGVRPVISIKGDLTVTGYGTEDDPFVVITS